VNLALDRVPKKTRSYVGPDGQKSMLFEPFQMRGATLPNRIAISPMGQHSSYDAMCDDWHLMHLGQFACSGVGTVFTGNIAPEPRGRFSDTCLGLWNDDQVASFGRLRRFVSDHTDSKLGVQFNHSGRKGSMVRQGAGFRQLANHEGGWDVDGPGSVPFPGRITPSPMSRDRILSIVEMFAEMTVRAERVGFDLIELHSAHGYLLHQFLSPLSNDRDDEFGGSLENRMRLPLMVFEAVRAKWPTAKPLGVRVSATDWVPGGWSPEETVIYGHELKKRGCDFMCVSTGGTTLEQNIPIGPLYQVPFAEMIRREVGIPVIAVGLITTPEQAESVIREGKADIVALGRAFIQNPHWTWDAARKLGGRIHLPDNYMGHGPG
jgi:2,4-dienoyl-CoA reductase-like NADH-dependent reductase (Old Yellow Enzyme family)